MKTTQRLFIIFSICLTLGIGANKAGGQSKFLEYTFQPSNMGSTTHAAVVTNGWMVPLIVGDCNPDRVAFINNKTGVIKYLPVPEKKGFLLGVYDIAQVAPNEFICAGYWGNQGGTYGACPMIFKIDSSGKLIWQSSFTPNDTQGPMWWPFTKMLFPPDSTLIFNFSSGHYLGKTTAGGKKYWLYSQSENAVDMVWNSKGIFMSGINHIWELNIDGKKVKDYYYPGSHHYFSLQNGPDKKIYASGLGNLYTIDSNMKLIDSVSFGFGFNEKVNGANVYVGDDAYYFYNQDSLASVNFKGKLNWKAGLPYGSFITGVKGNGEQIAVTGNGKTPFFKTYDKKGNTAPITRDIGIIEIIPGKISIKKAEDIFTLPEQKDISADIEIVVKNYGDEVIDSFYVGSTGPKSKYNSYCLDNYLKAFHNLNLKPGDTVKLRLGTFTRFSVNPHSNDIYDFDLTISTFSPNGKLDMNASNDAQSLTKAVAGINGRELIEASIRIYPNPVINVLSIENYPSGHNTCISIFNAAGQKVYEAIDQSNQIEIDLKGLGNGMYFVRIQNENNAIVRKFFKE